MFPFRQLNYLRNWSLVVPVCMKELAITVAVWHTEFRTASWSDGEKKYIYKSSRESRDSKFSDGTICSSSDCKLCLFTYALQVIHLVATLPLCF